jgi:predicted DNA-binding transcriptional regulator YafY
VARPHAGRSNAYGVLHTDGRWYLIGYCMLRRAIRTFRLDRVTEIAICKNTFRRPADFDARVYLKERMPFVQSDYQIDVWVDMPIEQAERTFAPWRIAMEQLGGGTRLRCGRDRLEMFAAMLLSMGCKIVVHSPDELRATFKELARRVVLAAKHPIGKSRSKDFNQQ